MKGLLLGIAFIVLIGLGGLVYRNALEHPSQPQRCPLDAKVCPDGTSVARTGSSCTFDVCPLPNVSLPEVAISFAIPEGFEAVSLPDEASIVAYALPGPTRDGEIRIRRYDITASSTALETIQKTAIGATSGLPVSTTSYSSTFLGNHHFTVVSLERFEGVVTTAFYLARGTDVLRFDAIDRGVMNWGDSNLVLSELPAHKALRELLTTLQGE